MDQPKAQTPERHKAAPLLASCVIFLVALNLHSRHRCSGSLALQHRNHIRLGRIATGAAWLPALLAFALFSMIVGALTAKLDSDKVLLWALIALAGGCIVRSLSGESMVWLGTLVMRHPLP